MSLSLPLPPSRACIMVMFMSFLIFFGDYTSILITGNSMRKVLLTTPTSVRCMCVTLYTQVMQTAGVSKNKFAFIIQSMAPSMASFVPISWFVRTPHRVCHLLCFVPQLGWCSNRLCLLWIGRLYHQRRSIHYSRQDPVYVIRSHTHTAIHTSSLLHCSISFLASTDGSVCGDSVCPQSRLRTNADCREGVVEEHSNDH